MISTPVPPPYGEKNYYHQGPPPPMAQPNYIGSPVVIVGHYPIQCICPQCRNQIVTRTEKKVGSLTWIICAVLFFFCMWLCCFIPFCVDGCKDTEHYCPACSAMIGVSKQI